MTRRYQAIVPSNIAFLKYWGKADESHQWPANDSLSMTLDGLKTTTLAVKDTALTDHAVTLNGQKVTREDRRGLKIFRHLDHLATICDCAVKLAINTHNSFPTGSGIASSASGLGALTIAALAAWTESSNLDALQKNGYSRERLAQLSRQGSGSAGRSLFGGIVVWEKSSAPESQSIYPLYPQEHWPLCDVIVLFSEEEKAVSSTQAHRAAWTSPLFEPRLAGLKERRRLMEAALQARDMWRLGPLLEQEALEMHGVIMSAQPSVHYFGTETGHFLRLIREIREEEGLPVYFTIDAGPNVHLILEEKYLEKLQKILQLRCPQRQLLIDRMGPGPHLSVEA